jgi:hypothetical protein
MSSERSSNPEDDAGSCSHDAVSLPRISHFGLLAAFAFVALSFVGRFLFPFGDEPDFEVRSYGVLYDDHPWWSPYSVFHNLIVSWDRDLTCDIFSTPLSLWGHISAGCGEQLGQILGRYGFTILLSLCLLVPIIFRRAAVRLLDPRRRMSDGEWALRLDALALALLLPSVIMALGVFAEEQFVVMLSLLLVLVCRNVFCTLFLLVLVFGLDLGNGLVVFTAVSLLAINRTIARRFGFRILYMIVAAELLVVLVVGFVFIDVLSSIGFLADKVGGMMSVLTDGDDQASKYPVILRPVVTFMTAIFMSAESLKAIPLYPIFGYAIVTWWKRVKRLHNGALTFAYDFRQWPGVVEYDECRVMLISAINAILLFVFLLPTYSNAKYYLFLIPFFLASALQVFDRRKMRALFIFSSLTVYIFLVLYRML